MIVVENVVKRFGRNIVVDGVSFVAEDGKITGLLGPNGAGKTTTMRLISGLMDLDAGTVAIDGRDVSTHRGASDANLGVLPDESGMYDRLTGREHIRYFGRLHGLSGAELEKRVDRWIEALGLSGVVDRRAAGYSRGERMKVAVARALVHDPHNVMLDEPTNGLDVMSARAVRNVVRRLRDEGHCVLFSSHVMQEVSTVCDTIVVLAKGRVVAHGTFNALLAQTRAETLEDAFVRLVGEDAVSTETS
jgi:sodium transport system ATP-binding protein